MRLSLTIALSCAAAPLAAQDIQLRPPLDCGPAANSPCIIQQFVDADPTSGSADYSCGALSYDGHKGTDFRVPTLADMAAGTDVLAAATGTVTATRDGMPDIAVTDPDAPDISGKECGNGLVIDHGNGWETQYCHLKSGSIAVSQGQAVEAGALIGQIGLSGETSFPHVHMSLRKDGAVVDPFDPVQSATCDAVKPDLWDDAQTPLYRAGGILEAGFHDAIPDYADLKQGVIDTQTLTKDAPALVIWAYMFGSRPGDRVAFDIKGPQGWSFQNDADLDRQQAEFFRASGKRSPPQGWPAGIYHGTVSLIRGDKTLQTAAVTIQIQ